MFATLEEAWGLSPAATWNGDTAPRGRGDGEFEGPAQAFGKRRRPRAGEDARGAGADADWAGGAGADWAGGAGAGGSWQSSALGGVQKYPMRVPGVSAAEARDPADFAPAPQLRPRRADDEAVVMDARRCLARAYAQYGLAGVLRLLPREAAAELGPAVGRGARKGRGAGGDLWDAARRFVSCPEKVLFALLCAFCMLVLWDSWKAEQAAHAAAAMASLHVPFSTVSM